MADAPNPADVADALMAGVGRLVRRVRQLPTDEAVTMPERAVLARLDRDGPTTSAELARATQISPQSMGTTVARLAERGLVRRDRDTADGRRVVLSLTRAGLTLLGSTRSTRIQQIAVALDAGFSPAELKRLTSAAHLIERLASTI